MGPVPGPKTPKIRQNIFFSIFRASGVGKPYFPSLRARQTRKSNTKKIELVLGVPNISGRGLIGVMGLRVPGA